MAEVPTIEELINASGGDVWGEHVEFKRWIWKQCVADDSTNSGYWEWVLHELEASEEILYDPWCDHCGKLLDYLVLLADERNLYYLNEDDETTGQEVISYEEDYYKCPYCLVKLDRIQEHDQALTIIQKAKEVENAVCPEGND